MPISFLLASVLPQNLSHVLHLSELAEILVQVLVTDLLTKTMQAFVAPLRRTKENSQGLDVSFRLPKHVNWGSAASLNLDAAQRVRSCKLDSVYSLSLSEHHLCLFPSCWSQRKIDSLDLATVSKVGQYVLLRGLLGKVNMNVRY